MRFKAAALPIVVLSLVTSSCSDIPDLVDSDWVSVRVEYCTKEAAGRVWSTTDPALLEDLRQTMRPGETTFLMAIFPSYTNEIEVVLSSGQRWMLCFRSERRLNFFDPDFIKRSFVVYASTEFYHKVSAQLEAPIDLSDEPCKLPRYL